MCNKIRKHFLIFSLFTLILSQSAIAHICQFSTYNDLLSSPSMKITKEWSTVQRLKDDSTLIVEKWNSDDLYLIQLLIEQFPFNSSPITIEKFEKYDGKITQLFDSVANKFYLVASFWPGENHYGIIVQINNINETPLRYLHTASINDDDINCSYFDDL